MAPRRVKAVASPCQENEFMRMSNRSLAIISLLLVLLAQWLVLAPAVADDEVVHDKGLLWRLQRGDGAASYLFGTIHSEDPEILRLSPVVQETFERSRVFVMEVVLDMNALAYMSVAMLFTDGSTLSALVDNDLFSKASQAMQERGVPQLVVDRMKPWAVATTLAVPKPETGQFMDAVLYERARAGEKTIEGLESAQEQVEVFAGMDMDTLVALLRDTVEQLPEMDDLFAELLGAYKERDLARLMEINRITLGAGDKELAAAFMRRVINDRNLRMTERMVPFLKQGDAFVAVGALHLPGSNGILHLLEKRGYTVTAIW
jgi:uncharacterized protein YbaP (TraB family)